MSNAKGKKRGIGLCFDAYLRHLTRLGLNVALILFRILPITLISGEFRRVSKSVR